MRSGQWVKRAIACDGVVPVVARRQMLWKLKRIIHCVLTLELSLDFNTHGSALAFSRQRLGASKYTCTSIYVYFQKQGDALIRAKQASKASKASKPNKPSQANKN